MQSLNSKLNSRVSKALLAISLCCLRYLLMRMAVILALGRC
jgi:hypothetical protein